MSDTSFVNDNLALGTAGLPADNQLSLKPTTTTNSLPTVSECKTHLRLLGAFVHLKEAVDQQGHDQGLPDGEAWELLCRAAATKFLEWSETVDARGAHLSMPPLDVLMVWHAFLLNPSAYRTYADEVLDGRLGGKGLDWDTLKTRLDTDDHYMDLPSSHHHLLPTNPPSSSHRPLTSSGFDPVAAVHRQHDFAAKMHALGWLTATPFPDALLALALARYARFLVLVRENPGEGLAPALDVDLAWHTHLLLGPRRYAAHCLGAAGLPRAVDHDDTLGGDDLAASAGAAARLYRARFGAPYELCHCAPCVVARFGGGGGGDGLEEEEEEEKEAAAAESEEGSSSGSVGCCAGVGMSGPKCKKNCQAACQNRCGRRCGYVCGACQKPK